MEHDRCDNMQVRTRALFCTAVESRRACIQPSGSTQAQAPCQRLRAEAQKVLSSCSQPKLGALGRNPERGKGRLPGKPHPHRRHQRLIRGRKRMRKVTTKVPHGAMTMTIRLSLCCKMLICRPCIVAFSILGSVLTWQHTICNNGSVAPD